jgi:hypothetical protein
MLKVLLITIALTTLSIAQNTLIPQATVLSLTGAASLLSVESFRVVIQGAAAPEINAFTMSSSRPAFKLARYNSPRMLILQKLSNEEMYVVPYQVALQTMFNSAIRYEYLGVGTYQLVLFLDKLQKAQIIQVAAGKYTLRFNTGVAGEYLDIELMNTSSIDINLVSSLVA